MKTLQVKGSDLKIGDEVHVWWNHEDRGLRPNRDVITKLVPYNGPLKYLFKEDAQIADFMYSKTGMTIENGNIYTVDRDI